MASLRRSHAMPFGAAILDDGRVCFRLWAPAARGVELYLEGADATIVLPMPAIGEGWHELTTGEVSAGSRYRYRIDGETLVPDPASRFQPDDVHGPSEVIDPAAHAWNDDAWLGRPWEEAVFYELHVGAFTPEGSFAAVIGKLDALVELGITAIELMPVADFPGRRNWGYDGVLPFAPDGGYGRPEDLKALVDAAHARGLMVFLDVVYNHFGPEGNYLHRYAPQFFTDRHHTPWGAAIDFDGPASAWVRAFYVHNALYWLEEFHLDGLRLDAVHAIIDDSRPHILEQIATAVRARFEGERRVHLVLENDANETRHLRADRHDAGYDAQWNDDLHHALHVIGTGETEGYYRDFAAAPLDHLGRALAEGFAWQGEPSAWRDGRRRGEPSTFLPPTAFVGFLQNHDQIGNRAFGERIGAIAEADALRALSAILLLAPQVPLLFMGQEWGSRRPFLFFCDFAPALAIEVTRGRRREFAAFPPFADAALRERIPDPSAPATFESGRLDWHERQTDEGRAWLAWHRHLLNLRREHVLPLLRAAPGHAGRHATIDGRVLRVRWTLADGRRLTLIANLHRHPAPLATADGGRCIFETATANGELPAWYVAWHVETTPA